MPLGDTSQRVRRFGLSSVLRFASAGLQLWGGIAGHETALIVEAGEEFTDGLTFGAIAIEAGAHRRGLIKKARTIAIGFALAAAVWATAATVMEVMDDAGEWTSPLGGFSFTDRGLMAAAIALGLSSIVFAINFQGRKSDRVSDKFAHRDSLRDFVIPSSILLLAAVRAPHWAEYIFETGGLVYGWYNVTQLMSGWDMRIWRR